MLEIKNIFDLQRFSYITNTVAGAVLSGSSEADYISNNDGDTVQIYAAAGNDTVYNYFGYYSTIDGGAGNDSISSEYSSYSTINAGEGADTLSIYGGYSTIDGGAGNDLVSIGSYGSKNTIIGGVGNDTIYSNEQSSSGHLYQYSNGDGYDVIYNYGMGDTISIASGYYSTSVSGNNLIIYSYKNINSSSANGAITLVGAAGKPVRIKGSFDIKPNSKIITNTNSSTLISGTSGKDTIFNNGGDTVNVYAGAGNDNISNLDGMYFTLDGGAGNDTIYNVSHYNGYGSINGGEGNDFIFNNTTYVTITGGAGNDSVINSYRSTIDGGTGNDYLENSGDYSSVNGGAGNDTIYNSGLYSTINGGEANDTIINSGNYSTIDAGAGNDVVSLGSYTSNNYVRGGTGNDTIFGGNSSNDTYSSYSHTYQYENGDGYDVIYNYASIDKVSIISGSYTKSTVGADVIISTYSDSNSTSANGAITLKSAAGKDINILDSLTSYIAVSSSSISVNGTSKNDTIENASYDYVTINADAGNDSIRNNYGYHSIINAASGNDTVDTSGDYSSINGGAGNDIISITSYLAWSNTIKGGTGNDTIYGSNNSTNYGHIYQYSNGDGYDLINNYGSADTITFTSGYYSMSTVGSNVILQAYKTASSVANGAITLAGAAGKTINVKGNSIKGGKNTWTLNYSTAKYGTSSKTLATVNGVKSVSDLSTSGKKITLKNSALNKKVTVSGSYEFDFAADYKNATISGTSKADTITARGSKLKIFGGKGNDSIKIFGTNQTISGGDGADTFVYAANGGSARITDFSANDTLKIGASGKGTYSTRTSGKNLIVSTADGGKITLVGGANLSDVNISGTPTVNGGITVSNNGKKITLTEDYYSEGTFSLTGNYKTAVTVDASDVRLGLNIIGNSYGNKIIGGTQNDSIDGGKGNDIIQGGEGDDTLIGGEGSDTLTGGKGSDVFVYNKGDGNDKIIGYTADDQIRFIGDTIRVSEVKTSEKDVIFTIDSKNNTSKVTVTGGYDKVITYYVNGSENKYGANEYVTFNKKGTLAILKEGYPFSEFTPTNYSNYQNSLVSIDGSAVDRNLNIVGNDGKNSILGGTQDDTIDGGAGADTIYGGDGNDSIFGGKGNDELHGGIGDDTLWGGKGNDKLYGEVGDGSDVFYYETGEGNDTIFGYEASVDKIILGEGTVKNYSFNRNGDVIFKIGDGQLVINKGSEIAINIYDDSGSIITNYNPS